MDDPYAELRSMYENVAGVTVNAGRGSQGIKFGTKMYVMFLKSDLLVKLPPDRVADLVAAGDGLAYDPGTGTVMKDRVLIPVSNRDLWPGLCEESRAFANV